VVTGPFWTTFVGTGGSELGRHSILLNAGIPMLLLYDAPASQRRAGK
jgi:hypothetical protein